MYGLTKEELKILKSLDSPKKIQDFLNSLKRNFEVNGDTCVSPRRVLREKQCHCIEGALLAAVAFHLHGRKPLIVDLIANENDLDHVIAVFKENNKWGAVSKTNQSVLRYREPVYNSLRELVMSYFHEYYNDEGEKTLRGYSRPVNIMRFGTKWITSEKNVWKIPEYLVKIKHYKILDKKMIKNLRKADEIEIKSGKLLEYQPPKK